MLISLLLSLGLSEFRSVAVTNWVRRHIAYIIAFAVIVSAALYLVKIGADKKEQEIRDAWKVKFEQIEKQSFELARQRAEMQIVIDERVQDAIAAAPKIECSISRPNVRKLNAIK